MGKVSDATSRLLTWIEAERREGYATPLPQPEREAMTRDIQVLVDAIDLESMGRDRRLTYVIDSEEICLFMAWSLKPGKPQIVAVCSSEGAAERFRPRAAELGGVFHVEKVLMDHPLGDLDLQSVMYREVIPQQR